MSYSLLLTKSKQNNKNNFNKSEKYFTHSLVINNKIEEEFELEDWFEQEDRREEANNLDTTINNNLSNTIIENNYEEDYTKLTNDEQYEKHKPINSKTHLIIDEKQILLNNDDLSNIHNLELANNNRISIQHFNDSETLTAEKCAAESILNSHEEKIPFYKLRADTEISLNNTETTTTNKTTNYCDWIRAPSFFDEQQISELTNEQIQFTLDYFILSGYRVSQMTKTYYDIEAYTKLLDEKEKDLELAATIGKQLLEKDQQLEAKIEYLELQLEKTGEMVNQLRYDITLKDNLLQSFLDFESDSNTLNDYYVSSKKAQTSANDEKLNEYKKKISELEDENDLLRNRADYFEKETHDLEKKESVLIENCFKELDLSQKTLISTQDELKSKVAQFNSQQELLDKLHIQIFELQSKIKCLTKDNTDLQLIYESSTFELQNQLIEMKEKYNECLRILSKTQEELNQLRKKHSKPRTSSTYNPQNISIEHSITFDSDESIQICNSNLNSANLARNLTYSSWMPSNSNSLASEVFCSLAKDYRAKNSSLLKQASQSSDFIKKVKEKLSKQIPGSNIDSCLPSDSEIDLMNNSSTSIGLNSTEISSYDLENAFSSRRTTNHFVTNNRAKFTNCPTPDSVLSTGSASIYSNLIGRSYSFILPEKLKIVKPLEGSQTLQHWQQLARPNLGCLFESQPGITVQASEELINTKLEQTKDELDDYDDGVNLDMFDDYDSHEYDENSSISTDQELNYFNLSKAKSNTNQLSPSRVELLSKLLEKEEQILNSENKQETVDTKETNFFLELFKTLSKKFSKSESPMIEKQTKYDLDDPDTPPSSPTNNQMTKSSSNILVEVFKSAKLKCRSALVDSLSTYFQPTNAPTPPATPTNELEDEEQFKVDETEMKQQEMNFFDQIVNKLSIFSFKTVNSQNKEANSNSDKPVIVKPLPIYAKQESNENIFKLEEEEDENEVDENDAEIELVDFERNKKSCETPPSSPSKFSPPLNYEENVEFNKNTSAFVRVASLNPYINKTVDLASLLGSLSSLKRNQRLCKYYY